MASGENFRQLIDAIAGLYHGLPLTEILASHYGEKADHAAECAPSDATVTHVVRAVLELEVDAMRRT